MEAGQGTGKCQFGNFGDIEMIRKIVIAVVALTLLGAGVFLVEMYPFAAGVAKDAKEKRYDLNSTFPIETKQPRKPEKPF